MVAARLIIKYWLPVFVYAIIIFYLSSLPGKEIPQLFTLQDIPAHFFEYAVLAILVNRALKAHRFFSGALTRFLWTACLCVIFAASDEFHQAFVPNRDASFYDVISDTAGILAAHVTQLWRR